MASIVNDKTKYYLDDRLKKQTDERLIPALKLKDKDFFAIIDGMEGSGKSTLAFQWAKYVDPSFNLSRICFTPEEFKDAIFKAKKGQAIVYDEAFTGLSSRRSLSSLNGYLVSLAMQMRQKNLFIILALPSVFLLDKYFVMFRSKVLIHVYENHGIRGYFRVYSPKKIKQLILLGKQTYSYSKKVYTRFKGRFYGVFALGEEEEIKYRKKKSKALEEGEKNPMSAGQVKYREQRNLAIYLLRKNAKFTYEQLSNLLYEYDIDISTAQIGQICSKFGDKPQVNYEKDTKTDEKETKRLKRSKKQGKSDEIDEKEQENEEKEDNINENELKQEESDEISKFNEDLDEKERKSNDLEENQSEDDGSF